MASARPIGGTLVNSTVGQVASAAAGKTTTREIVEQLAINLGEPVTLADLMAAAAGTPAIATVLAAKTQSIARTQRYKASPKHAHFTAQVDAEFGASPSDLYDVIEFDLPPDCIEPDRLRIPVGVGYQFGVVGSQAKLYVFPLG